MRSIFASIVFVIFGVVPVLLAQEAVEPVSQAEAKEKATIERFWSILAKNPRRGTSFDRVYGYYVDSGESDLLVEKCRELTEKSPRDAKGWLLLGLVLSRRNDDAGTIAAYEQAESLDPNDAIAPFYLGEALIAQGRLKEAAQAIERSVERKPAKNDILPILQTLGRVYERFGDQKKSDAAWSRIEELFPNDTDILVRIAETLEEEGKFAEALSRYQKLAELSKKDDYARVRFTLSAADIKIRLGNKQEAIDDFEKLLGELADGSWLADSVRDRVERVFVRQADYAGLTGYYQKRLEQHPNDLETTRRLAVALVRLARTEEAKKLLFDILEKAPSNTKLRLSLIDLLVNDKDFEEVDRQYTKLNEIDPNNPDYISQWGLAVLENQKLGEQPRKDAAAKIWTRLIAARPNDLGMIVMVADLMSGAGINAEAERLYQKAVELSPNDPTYREYLGYYYHRRNEREKVVEALQQIATENRRTTTNLTQLGGILRSLGYNTEALFALKEATELAPNDFELQLRYCDLLTDNDKIEEAKTQLGLARTLLEVEEKKATGDKAATPVEELESFTKQEIKLLTAAGELRSVADALSETEIASTKDFWRLAVYRQADGDWEAATVAIEKALEQEPRTAEKGSRSEALSLLVLQTAAEIYAKGFNQSKAAEIYEKLASADPAHRVDHLKRLANLQREMGESDKAIETARLVMATGAGNAANSRFYADMLLGIGRRADGIEALRRAVRIDPSDQVSLGALADQLAESGQSDEAIEIVWRIFARTEDLQGKMGVIGRLSNYYQRAQRFDQLIERLRQDLSDPARRREAAYCLAQAHLTVGDYFAARNALEMLLTNVDEEKTNDTFLLTQLARVAEAQGDFVSAIRYQEMLCDLTSSPQDMKRLLDLYYASGEKEKASALYLQTIVAKADLVDQIDALDKLLAQEDYATAKILIERLEPKYPDNWELAYRKLETLYWLKDEGAKTIAAELRKTSLQEMELSAAKQKEANAPKKIGDDATQGRSANYGRGANYSPWGFGRHQGYTSYSQYAPGSGGQLAIWQNQYQSLLQTVFREYLQLEQYYYNRGMGSNRVPEKPLFKPENFGDAKFATLIWEMKFAFDEDKANEPKKDEKDQTDESGQNTDTSPVPSGEQAAKSSDESATAEESEAVDSRPFERFLKAVSETLAAYPDTSEDKAVLLTRLRLGSFLGQWDRSNIPDMPPQKSREALMLEVNAATERLTSRLGLAGEKDWRQAAIASVFQSLVRPYLLKTFESLDLDKELDDPASVFAFMGEEERKNFKKDVASRIEKLKKEESEKGKDTISDAQKLDWLFETLMQTAREKPEDFSRMIPQYSELAFLLKKYGRDADLAALDALIEKTGEDDPLVFFAMASVALGSQEFYMNALFKHESFLQESNAERFEKMKYWILKGKESLLRELGKKSAIRRMQQIFSMNVGHLFSQYLSQKIRSDLVRVYGKERLGKTMKDYALISSGQYLSPGVTYAPYMPIAPGGVAAGTAEVSDDHEKIVLTKDDVEILAALDRRVFETLDLYFAVQGEINDLTLAVAKKSVPTIRQQLQSLSQYRYYFEGRNRLDTYEIQRLLNPGQMGVQFDMFLATLPQTLEGIDTLGKNAATAADVSEKPVVDSAERFADYIAKKADDPDPGVNKIAKNFQAQPNPAQNRPTDDSDANAKILAKLNEEYAAAEAKGETMPPSKLFLLAILQSQSDRFEQAIAVLDAIPFSAAADVKLREMIVLQLYPRTEQSSSLRQRAQKAIDRLLGYQLTSEELRTLRASLLLFDRTEEANALRDRLLLTANDLNTQAQLLEELRNAGDAKKDETVQFALKVFRSPALSGARAMQESSYERHVKSQALDILKNAGKLEEIIEQIEAQWKSSPGSFEIMVSLIDIYNRANRKEDAKKLVEEMGKQVPEDPQKMLAYAGVLRGTGQKEKAADWTTKALEKDPTLFFNNYWEYQRVYTDAGQGDKLIALLKKMKTADLMQNAHNLSNCFSDLMRNDKTKEAARELFEHFWQLKEGTEDERAQMRRSLVDGMIFNTNEEFYPYFREVVLNAISLPPEKKKAASQQTQQHYYVSNPLETRGWSSDRTFSLGDSLLEMAEKKKKLEELRDEVAAIVDAFANAEKEKQTANAERWTTARILLAMIELKLKNTDKGLEILSELKADPKKETVEVLNKTAITLAQALEGTGDSKAADLGIEFCETGIKNQRGGFADSFLEKKLILLYLKSGHPEKGRDRGLDSIRKNLRLLKQCGTNHQIQVGNNYYGLWELSESIKQCGNALRKAGFGIDLLLIYRQQCAGQPWYRTFCSNDNTQHYSRQVKEVFDSLLADISAEELAKHIDLMIPLGSVETQAAAAPETAAVENETMGETTTAKDEKTAATKEVEPPAVGLPLELGMYFASDADHVPELPDPGKYFAQGADHVPGQVGSETRDNGTASKLSQALQILAKTDPEKFAKVRAALDVLQDRHPEEPSVWIARTFGLLVADEVEPLLKNLARYPDWLKEGDDPPKEFADQIYLGTWLIGRTIYAEPEKYRLAECAADCEKLTLFVGRLVGKKIENRDQKVRDEGKTLKAEMQRFVPDSLKGELKISVSSESLKNSLFPSGVLAESLIYKYNDIIKQYTDAVNNGDAEQVFNVFEEVFANGWPSGLGSSGWTGADYVQAKYLRIILDAVLEAADKAGVNPDIVVDALFNIVLPLAKHKTVFLGVYGDLGGRNGEFHSLAVPMFQWVIKGKRTRDCQRRYAEFMQLHAEEPIFGEGSTKTKDDLMLPSESLRLMYGIAANESDIIQPCVEGFVKKIRDEHNAQAPLFLLIAIEGTGIRVETLDLFDLCLARYEEGLKFPRYAYYIIRKHWQALPDSGWEGAEEMAVRWANLYFAITKAADIQGRTDGFRKTLDDRLMLLGEKAIATNNLPLAVEVLKYFAQDSPDSFRYRDLTAYLKALEEKLAALDPAARRQLLGELDLSSIVKTGKVVKDEAAGKPRVADSCGLPELPVGTVVYQNDFENGDAVYWNNRQCDITPIGKRTYLGEFLNEPIRLELRDLPAHKLLRIKFDLFMLDGLDGLVGAPRSFGVDSWEMKIDGRLRPIAAAFSNFHKDPNNQKQTYPDDYPPLFGITHSWEKRVQEDDLWGDNLEVGMHYGRHGASEENSLGTQQSAVYAVDIIVPHDKSELGIDFKARFQDGPFSTGVYKETFGEAWGLDNFRVETIEAPWSPTEDELKQCLDALLEPDGIKANAARYRLVAAGDRAIDYMIAWAAAPENEARSKEIGENGNFYGFRVVRVLQLIDTPKAQELLKRFKISDP